MVEQIKIIFLDIDGVLNSERFYRTWLQKYKRHVRHDDYGQMFDPLSKKLLNKLIRETSAKIVISSTWRHAGLKEMRDMWRDRKMAGEVIGITPDFRASLRDNAESGRFGQNLNRLINHKCNDHGVSVPRGCEIEWYYKRKHKFEHWQWDGPYVQEQKAKCTLETYVIFDDDSDMLYQQRNNFVHCKNKTGLTQKEYDKALKILNCGDKSSNSRKTSVSCA